VNKTRKSGHTLQLRVIHVPQNIGNNVYPLNLALRKKGVESDCLVHAPHSFGYEYDFITYNPKKTNRVYSEFAKIYWILRIIRQYNTVHFNFGTTLAGRVPPSSDKPLINRLIRFPYRSYLYVLEAVELRLFKVFKIKMFIHYQGDDARQGAPMRDLEISLLQGVSKNYYSEKSDRFKSSQIKRISSFVEKTFYVNPDLSVVLPPESLFIPYSHIDVRNIGFIPRGKNGKEIKIVHAPSNRAAKGTSHILETIEKIQSMNPQVTLELIENLPHIEAMAKYREADLVIDQLLAGWYGGLAVEAMAIGVPVMCYLRKEDFRSVNPKMIEDLPIISVNRNNLEQKILDFLKLTDEEILELRKVNRRFVEKWHDVEEIAEQVLNYYGEAHESNQ
jgi:hypothetical protein